MSDRTTARAQRRQAVADGTRSDAVDRRSPRSDPRGSAAETTSRDRQQQAARDVAGDIDIDREGVGTVDRLDGLDVFLRSPGEREWGSTLRTEFADEADFVERDDVDAGIDPDAISAAPEVAPGRRDRVADRARRETAADAEFIEQRDLDADVGAMGVRSIEVREDHRPAVAERTRTQLAADDPFAQPDDFEAEVGAAGIEQAGLTDTGARRRAGRQFEAETPLETVDPDRDVTADGDAFALDDPAQRRIAAREFEAEIDLFDTGALDPATDIRDTDAGFGLGEEPARQVAAADLDRQIDEMDVTASDIQLEDTGDGWEAVFEREVRR